MRRVLLKSVPLAAALALAAFWYIAPTSVLPGPLSVIVEGSDLRAAADAVRAVGGSITHELGVIDGVAARVDARQIAALRARGELRVFEDGAVELASKGNGSTPYTNFPALVGADRVHTSGITGKGVGIAVIDSGMHSQAVLNKGGDGAWRATAQYDAFTNKMVGSPTFSLSDDLNGHGTHVASIALSSANVGTRNSPRFNGIAPDATFISVRAFDAAGRSTYADVIRGIDWVVQNRATYGIRVLNCSFSTAPRSHYALDPLSRAVMRAWQAGIVVVASAGNKGPTPMSIGVPGNTPYVITVGAVTDNYTPSSGGDDFLARFSAVGPTRDRFVKPDLVAPGGHMLGIMGATTTIATSYPEFHDGNNYFTMSGTSQAAAVVTGVAALVLQRDPTLTPDQVKYRLMDSARRGLDANGRRQYSIFQQGAGLVDAHRAVFGVSKESANRNMDLAADLAGAIRYSGLASRDANGLYHLRGTAGDGYEWNGSYLKGSAILWSDAILWNDAILWADAVLWNDAILWADAVLWNDAILWSDAILWADSIPGTAGINLWVPQE